MRKLVIPAGPTEQVEVLCELLGPLGGHPHWRALATYLVNQRGLLIYSGNRVGEDWNLSNWFGLLNDREGFYEGRECGGLVRSLYIAHELAHLIMPTGQRMERGAFAAAFDLSERLASYETELRVYDDVVELAELVPFSPLLASWLRIRGVDLADAPALMAWRDAVVAQPGLLADELPSEAARMACYGDNVGWAGGYWDRLARIGWWDRALEERRADVALAHYREMILTGAAAAVEEGGWREKVCNNVRRAYLLCGRADPGDVAFEELGELAVELDGWPLATDETVTLYEQEGEHLLPFDDEGKLAVMPSVYSVAFGETNRCFDEAVMPPELWNVSASRAQFDAALVGWGLGKLPWAGEKKLGLMDLMHEPIVEGILGVIGRSVPGIDSAARPWRYPLHGSAAGIGQLMTHLRVVESVREIYLLQGDYEGYAAQATNNGLAVRVLGRDEAMGISGAVWFISNPSAIDGEPLGDTWVAELCEHNRVVVDVAYHGLCGQRSVVVPESAWAVLWSLSKPWGLFWRRVGILAACVEIPCAYGTRWYKDPQALMGAWAVVAKYEPWAMAERYRWAQNEAVALLAGVGVRTRAASTLLLARVHQTDVDEAVWEQLGRAERVNGSGVARVCLSPLIEALIAREHGLRG